MSFAWISCIVSHDVGGLCCRACRNICACCDFSWCAVERWRFNTPCIQVAHWAGRPLAARPGALGQFSSAALFKSILSIHVASRSLTVGPHWHNSILTLKEVRLDGACPCGWTLNLHTVDTGVDFSYVKRLWALLQLWAYLGHRTWLDCPCSAVVIKWVKKWWCPRGDWGLTV